MITDLQRHLVAQHAESLERKKQYEQLIATTKDPSVVKFGRSYAEKYRKQAEQIRKLLRISTT